MKTFIQNGTMITVTAPTGGVVVGSLFGVAASTAAEGESVEIAARGVYILPKNAAAVIAQGARVAWDATEKRIDLPDTRLYPVGIATEAAGDGLATVRVRLHSPRYNFGLDAA